MSAVLVTLVVVFIIPAAVKLLASWTGGSTWTKQFLSALLAAVSALVTTATAIDGTAVFSSTAAVLALGAFILAQASYRGLYKPHAGVGP